MLLSVHAIDGSDSAPTAGDWSIGPGLDLRQLGAGVDAQCGECIVDMVSHGMEGKVQLRGDAALLDYARQGDAIVVVGIDRLGRNAAEVMKTYVSR
jgi:DNA invertase Pin-like site-specific DNA recombinase